MKKPETYHEPSSRAFADWGPARVRAARALAEAGELRLAADLVGAMLGDDRVSGAIGVRIRGLLGLPLSLEPAAEGAAARRAVDALEAGFWAMLPEDALFEVYAWALLLGVGLGEIVWGEEADRPRLKPWHPRFLRWDWETRRWLLEVEGRPDRIPVEPGDGKWVLLLPYGEHRPWNHGLWRALAFWWLLKAYAIQDWARFSEVHGSPIRVGKTPNSATPGDREALANDLAELARDTAIALPPGFELELVEARSQSWETFRAEIERADTAIAVAILGQNLTTEVKGGSYAAAKVHDQVRRDLLASDAEVLSTQLRAQFLEWWAEWELGDRTLAPWPRWDLTPPPDAESARIYEYHLKYQVLTTNEIRERLGLPPVEGGDRPPTPIEETAAAKLIRLASGDRPSEAKGFVQGQFYADAVADRLVQRAAEVERKAFAPVMAELERAQSYDEVRAILMRHYRDAAPEEIARLAERALLLAELGGRYAVLRDLD